MDAEDADAFWIVMGGLPLQDAQPFCRVPTQVTTQNRICVHLRHLRPRICVHLRLSRSGHFCGPAESRLCRRAPEAELI